MPINIPEISVIVPVYNVAGYVAACIDSLRAQDLVDFEVIVVDDGSTDDSHARAVAAISGDDRFTVLRQSNGGLSAARNTGLARARGRFVAFVDSDDRVTRDYLSVLRRAIDETGADWASCAVHFAYPQGEGLDHSAIHSAPVPQGIKTRLMPLQSWAQVIDHFPSAWNKLYRAELISGLQFDEGLLFEDHAFFQRAARRTEAIAHVPHPLYLQTRARPGQITGEDTDRVFDQIEVLDRLAAIMDGRKSGGVQAYAALASRLLFERAGVIRHPERRAAFVQAGRTLLERHSVRYMPDWPRGIGASFGSELAGQAPLSVVIPWNGDQSALQQTLASLAAAEPCGAEYVIVCDRVPVAKASAVADRYSVLDSRVVSSPRGGPGNARNAGLEAAVGTYLIFLDAGDVVKPWMPLRQVNQMLELSAQVGLAPFLIGTDKNAGLHDGWHDATGLPEVPALPELMKMTPELAIGICPHPSAKMFSRGFLNRYGLRYGEGALADWGFTLAVALRAERVLRFAQPGVAVSQDPACRSLWLTPVAPSAMMRAIDAIDGDALGLPLGWQHRLFARALWEKSTHIPMSRFARLRFWLDAGAMTATLPTFPDRTRLDPYIDPRITALLRSSGQSRLRCIKRALGR